MLSDTCHPIRWVKCPWSLTSLSLFPHLNITEIIINAVLPIIHDSFGDSGEIHDINVLHKLWIHGGYFVKCRVSLALFYAFRGDHSFFQGLVGGCGQDCSSYEKDGYLELLVVSLFLPPFHICQSVLDLKKDFKIIFNCTKFRTVLRKIGAWKIMIKESNRKKFPYILLEILHIYVFYFQL